MESVLYEFPGKMIICIDKLRKTKILYIHVFNKYWSQTIVKKNQINTKQLEPPNVLGILPVKSVDELLEKHTGQITQINELAGLSKDNFNLYYLSAINQYARFVQQLPASEVHHHSGIGGMLSHGLDVCVIALKVRRSYLLSDTGGAEEISEKQDLWTYSVFLAALCHDLAKVAVDQVLTIYDINKLTQTWEPWCNFIDEQGQWYTSEFVRNRQYRLHEKASPLLIYKIIPTCGMKWLSSDQTIFSKWIASISGDMENASSIGEIVSIADSKSVAANLGADNSRMPTVKTKPLHEKMLTALRYLLSEGELPINRNGAAGWTKNDYCWLVSKRTVDAIREHLIQEGHSGIPTNNGRLFDILQEHGVLTPYSDKAIWSATVEGEGWSNDLTLIKVAMSKIWTNSTNRPDDFEGRIITPDAKELEKKEKEDSEVVLKNDSLEFAVIQTKPKNTGVDKKTENNPQPLPDQGIATTFNDDPNFSMFLPSLTPDIESNIDNTIDDVFKHSKTDSHKENTVIKQSLILSPSNLERNLDTADMFFDWLQNGIQNNILKTNQAKARVHTVEGGVILITPGIFQDFARSQCNKNDLNWSVIQQKVLKKNWHVRDDKGLNIVKYRVKGTNKSTSVNAILLEDISIVFGSEESPSCNPHLIKY